MMGAIAFYILSFLTVASALMVVFSRKPVHSVLYLIFCFFTMAGHYVILNAQFLAAVHIIVYGGAIMVLFLFVIMLLNLNQQVQENKRTFLQFAAVVTGGLMLVVLVASMKGIGRLERVTSMDSELGLVKNLGMVLYREYMLPFEALSILFLAAMVGSVLIGKKEKA
ncbi:MAG: NADH-quinone oxidoreductase subunit J [Bacteroidia bacterium]|nr:NADH-quinone oxidoreductase subunit J [Bacteroidia bacterium]